MIGAAVTLSELLEHPRVPDYIRLPIRQMASLAIRNMGTLAGNLCNASASGDSLPMLYALDAEVTLASTRGTRKLPVGQFIIFAKQTLLQPDELATEITIPLHEYTVAYYRKIGGRKVNAISKASFYAVAIKKDGIVEDVRIAFGSVAPTAVRDRACEEILIGTAETELDGKIETLRTRYGELLAPLDDTRSSADYRRQVSLQLLEDFIGRGLAT
jgi:CO/xanthine dehydrogenase FAD-binding subunit